MKTLAVFLVCLGIAIARGDPTPNKANQLENKNAQQASKPAGSETASSRTGDLQLTNMAYQDNRMHSAHSQDQQTYSQQQSQLHNSQSLVQPQTAASAFHSQNQGSPITAQPFFSQSQPQQQFHNQGEIQQQQFSGQGRSPAGSPLDPQMGMVNLLQSQQQQQQQRMMNPAALSLIQAHSKEQVNDFSAQQMYSGSGRPDQELYQQDRRNVMDVLQQDQFNNERRYSDSSRQQGQISGKGQSMDIRPGGYPQIYQARSAFDNREQPLVLPGVSQTSTSVVVSGLKNLPVLPGLVYSAGAVPSAHVVAYSRPWYQGGAYIKQHWQTPFARYVYSHIL